MNDLKRSNGGELRIILCVQFDHRAKPSEIRALQSELRGSPNCVHSLEVTGGFDLIAEFSAPGIGWYKKWLSNLADPFARVVNRYEVSFVFAQDVKRVIDEDAVWVPENGGFRRIDIKLIDKVAAEGDYVRIYSKGKSWMLHETMKAVSARLPPADFVRVHRSTIIRFQFIERVARENNRWIAYLTDGSKAAVARSHVPEALEVARGRRQEQPVGSAIKPRNVLQPPLKATA